jgi:hypothetical protein
MGLNEPPNTPIVSGSLLAGDMSVLACSGMFIIQYYEEDF